MRCWFSCTLRFQGICMFWILGLSIIDNQRIVEEIYFASLHHKLQLAMSKFLYLHLDNSQKDIFKTKCYQEPLASFIEVGHFGCFGASIIMQDKVGEYGLEGNIWVMAQHEVSTSSWFELYIVRSSIFSTFIFERILTYLQFCVKDQFFPTCHLKGRFWCLFVTLKG